MRTSRYLLVALSAALMLSALPAAADVPNTAVGEVVVGEVDVHAPAHEGLEGVHQPPSQELDGEHGNQQAAGHRELAGDRRLTAVARLVEPVGGRLFGLAVVVSEEPHGSVSVSAVR